MRKDKNEAIVLRKTGSTYKDIQSKLGIPRSTLSTWFKGEKWSNDVAIEAVKRAQNSAAIRLVVLNTVRGNRLKKIYEEAIQDALVDYSELKFHPLFLAGVILYSARGEKTQKSRIFFSSSDPAVILIMKRFLNEVCGMEKIKAQLLIRSDLSREVEIKAYWSEKAGFNSADFLKTMKISPKKGLYKPDFGVCNIMVNSAYLKNKILKWIELAKEELGKGNFVNGPGSL